MKNKFKPFQKVIVKSKIDNKWHCEFYSHYNAEKNWHTVTTGTGIDDKDILPYGGNEHLVGTTDEPEKEVKLEEGELLVVSDYSLDFTIKIDAYNLQIFRHANVNCFECRNGHIWRYAIRFKDFDPNNMEETKKHILCVKNGKITKYRK